MLKLPSSLQGAAFALVGFGLFATHDAIIKFLGGEMSAFQIVFFRTLLGFPVVTIMLMRDRTDGNLRPRHPRWVALRMLTDVVGGTAAFYAFSRLPLAQVYALLFSTPLLVTLLSIPVLGEKVGLRRGLAVMVGLIGVLIVIRPGQASFSTGHLAAVLSALAGATSSIISRKIGQHERSAVMLLYPMVANFLVMGAMLPFVYRPVGGLALGGLALVALLAVIAGLFNLAAYRRSEAVIVAPMQYSQIVWAAFYGYVFFNEGIDGYTALGIIVIVASGLYIVFRESFGQGSKNRPVTRSRWRPDAGILTRIGQWTGRGRTGL